MLSPHVDITAGDIKRNLNRLAEVALPPEEHEVVQRSLKTQDIPFPQDRWRYAIEDTGFSQFYVAYRIMDDIVLLEIKLYQG
jgi:hypothetical protein